MNKKGVNLNRKRLDDLKGTVNRYFSSPLFLIVKMFLIFENILTADENILID